jgi:DNA-binding NarL/FixJ family response regulator
MTSVRILVADDHSLTRRGVRALLETKPGWKVCGEAITGAEAILKTRLLKPDVVIMDFAMPEVNGLEATRQIHAEMPEVAVLILTMHESGQLVREAINVGARGYVLKSDLDRILFTAIPAMLRGKNFFSPKASAMVINRYLKERGPKPAVSETHPEQLTPRQLEVVRHLAQGKLNKEVALALNISAKTVEAHRAQIMRRLQLRSFSELVRYAVRQGLVDV